MRSVLGKIADSLEGTVSMGLEALTDQFTVLSDDYACVEAHTWEAAALAINRQEEIEMVYQRFDGVTKVYRLEPYHLLVRMPEVRVLGPRELRGRILERLSKGARRNRTGSAPRLETVS